MLLKTVHFYFPGVGYPVYGAGLAILVDVVRICRRYKFHHNTNVELRLPAQCQGCAQVTYQLDVICE